MLNMADKSSINIESLLSNLKAAQNARACLEKDLAEKRQQRCQTEKMLAAVNAKWTQAKDIYAKMQETRNVAQYKVDQTQALFDSLEKTNESKRDTVTKLEEQIQVENDGRENDVSKFEDELAFISKCMRDAKGLYSNEKLGEEYGKSVSSEAEQKKLGEKYQTEICNMDKHLQELQEVDQNGARGDSAEILSGVHTLEMFEKAEKDVDVYLKQINPCSGQ